MLARQAFPAFGARHAAAKAGRSERSIMDQPDFARSPSFGGTSAAPLRRQRGGGHRGSAGGRERRRKGRQYWLVLVCYDANEYDEQADDRADNAGAWRIGAANQAFNRVSPACARDGVQLLPDLTAGRIITEDQASDGHRDDQERRDESMVQSASDAARRGASSSDIVPQSL